MSRWRTWMALTAVVLLAALPAGGARVEPGSVSGKVTIRKDGKAKADHAGAVVYLDTTPDADGATPPAQKSHIRQKDLKFRPDVAVVTVGSTIEFPNDDKVFHNVFSVS